MDTMEHVFHSLKPLASKAQILVQLDPHNSSPERIYELLKAFSIEPTIYDAVDLDHPAYMKLLLPKADLRRVILMLTEAGYHKIMGLDAAPDQNEIKGKSGQ